MVNIRNKVVMKDLNKLIEYENNNKNHPEEQISLLVQNIDKFGFTTPFLIDSNNNLIAGHGRKLACDRLGIKKVPCIVVDDLTEDEIKSLRIADNRLGELGETNWMNLKEEFLTLKDTGLDFLTGYTDTDFDFIEEPGEVEEDDYEVPEDVNVIGTDIKRGDIIKLGNHRLMCGDSTEIEDVEKLTEQNKLDMCFTDPPYNLGFSGSMSNTTKNGVRIKDKGANQRHEEIHNDKKDKKEFYEFISKSLENIKSTIIGAYYITFCTQTLDELIIPMREQEFNWKSIIVWMKNQATLSGKDYKGRYEPIVYGRFNEEFYAKRYLQEDIWEHQRTLKNDLHPTMKPIHLIAQAIENSSKQGQTVLDLFGGSGSTLIACEQLNRKCYMMELDEKYCEVICQRWEKLTGKKREVLNE